MAEQLRIQAVDLAKVLHGMQARQPTGLNGWGIIQVVSGLVSAIEPDPDRSAQYPFSSGDCPPRQSELDARRFRHCIINWKHGPELVYLCAVAWVLAGQLEQEIAAGKLEQRDNENASNARCS